MTICIKFASHHWLLYVVYMCQKSLNFTYSFKCYQQKCKWLHFSWATLYIRSHWGPRVSHVWVASWVELSFPHQTIWQLSFLYSTVSKTVNKRCRSCFIKSGASWIDPDFRERSLTKRFVAARALSFFGIIKNFDPTSFSHVTQEFVKLWFRLVYCLF